MQLVNGAQLLHITFLLALFASVSAVVVLLTVIVSLASLYPSSQPHIDFSVVVWNLI